MNTIDLKEHVRRAIKRDWPAFASAHPRLAAVLDESLLVEQATQSLSQDPEFQHALHRAAAAGVIAEVLTDLVPRRVTAWLRALL